MEQAIKSRGLLATLLAAIAGVSHGQGIAVNNCVPNVSHAPPYHFAFCRSLATNAVVCIRSGTCTWFPSLEGGSSHSHPLETDPPFYNTPPSQTTNPVQEEAAASTEEDRTFCLKNPGTSALPHINFDGSCYYTYPKVLVGGKMIALSLDPRYMDGNARGYCALQGKQLVGINRRGCDSSAICSDMAVVSDSGELLETPSDARAFGVILALTCKEAPQPKPGQLNSEQLDKARQSLDETAKHLPDQ